MADLRDRGTSILTALCNFAVIDGASVRAISVTAGAAFVALVSTQVGDFSAPVIGLAVAVGFYALLVVPSNPTPDVPSGRRRRLRLRAS